MECRDAPSVEEVLLFFCLKPPKVVIQSIEEPGVVLVGGGWDFVISDSLDAFPYLPGVLQNAARTRLSGWLI